MPAWEVVHFAEPSRLSDILSISEEGDVIGVVNRGLGKELLRRGQITLSSAEPSADLSRLLTIPKRSPETSSSGRKSV